MEALMCHRLYNSSLSLSTIPTSLSLSRMKFYKIIRSGNVERSKLKLPGKFEKRFGDTLPRNVTLIVPSGAKWRVGVRKDDDGVWLVGQGWAEFAGCLGLGYGDFLMFEYDAVSAVFHVVVMGMSASEIKYPALATADDDDDDDDDDDVVLLSGCATLESKKPPTRCRDRAGESKDPSGVGSHYAVKKRGYQRCNGETILDNKGRIQCVVQGRNVYQVTDEAEQTLARARAFKYDEPTFIIALQPSYLTDNKSCRLLVPRSFILEHFDLAVKEVILETREARTWPVAYRLSGRAYFTNGWKQFADDNCLATGHVCVFELNRRGACNALKVAIFRTTGEDEVPRFRLM